jgi:predicted DNA-binding protein with PD1-like motif
MNRHLLRKDDWIQAKAQSLGGHLVRSTVRQNSSEVSHEHLNGSLMGRRKTSKSLVEHFEGIGI